MNGISSFGLWVRSSWVVAVIAACSGLSSAWAAKADKAGQVVSVAGKVLVRNIDNPSGPIQMLKTNDLITTGTVINTSSSASVKILMTDRTILDLGPSTLFKVDDYVLGKGSDRTVKMSMDYGKVRASVNQPIGENGAFQIKTKSATMGVRGTEFIVDAGPPIAIKSQPSNNNGAPTVQGRDLAAVSGPAPTQITVVHGVVAVSSSSSGGGGGQKETARLTAGSQMMTSSVLAETPKISTLSVQEVSAVKSEAKLEDRTFSSNVVVGTSGQQDDSKGGGGRAPASGPGAGGGQTMKALATVVESSTQSMPDQLRPQGVPGAQLGPQNFQIPVFQDNGPSRIHVTFSL